MSESLSIFIIGLVLTVLLGVVAFFGKLILNQILNELKNIRKDFGGEIRDIKHDVYKLREATNLTRSIVSALPCKVEVPHTCYTRSKTNA